VLLVALAWGAWWAFAIAAGCRFNSRDQKHQADPGA